MLDEALSRSGCCEGRSGNFSWAGCISWLGVNSGREVAVSYSAAPFPLLKILARASAYAFSFSVTSVMLDFFRSDLSIREPEDPQEFDPERFIIFIFPGFVTVNVDICSSSEY